MAFGRRGVKSGEMPPEATPHFRLKGAQAETGAIFVYAEGFCYSDCEAGERPDGSAGVEGS